MFEILKELIKDDIDMYGELATRDLIFSDELINNCKLNHCGKYNKSWMCPPAIGNQYDLINQYRQYQKVFVFSKIAKLEDPFDLEGMENGRKRVEQILRKVNKKVNKNYNYKILGPGTCTICKECTYPNDPCRFPELAAPSLEALGINVLDLAKSCNIKYYNGPNTVTYFAAIFYN